MSRDRCALCPGTRHPQVHPKPQVRWLWAPGRALPTQDDPLPRVINLHAVSLSDESERAEHFRGQDESDRRPVPSPFNGAEEHYAPPSENLKGWIGRNRYEP